MATDENRDTFLSPAAIQYQTCVRCDQLTLRELSGLTYFLWRSNLLARSSPETGSARSVFRNIPTPPNLPSHSNHSAMSVFFKYPNASKSSITLPATGIETRPGCFFAECGTCLNRYHRSFSKEAYAAPHEKGDKIKHLICDHAAPTRSRGDVVQNQLKCSVLELFGANLHLCSVVNWTERVTEQRQRSVLCSRRVKGRVGSLGNKRSTIELFSHRLAMGSCFYNAIVTLPVA